MSDRDTLDYQEWVWDSIATRTEATKRGKMRILIKNKNGSKDEVPKHLEASLQDAKSHMTPAQTDRFYRAVKVWFVPKSGTFEFEDTHV